MSYCHYQLQWKFHPVDFYQDMLYLHPPTVSFAPIQQFHSIPKLLLFSSGGLGMLNTTTTQFFLFHNPSVLSCIPQPVIKVSPTICTLVHQTLGISNITHHMPSLISNFLWYLCQQLGSYYHLPLSIFPQDSFCHFSTPFHSKNSHILLHPDSWIFSNNRYLFLPKPRKKF